jgi:hypothetical protein
VRRHPPAAGRDRQARLSLCCYMVALGWGQGPAPRRRLGVRPSRPLNDEPKQRRTGRRPSALPAMHRRRAAVIVLVGRGSSERAGPLRAGPLLLPAEARLAGAHVLHPGNEFALPPVRSPDHRAGPWLNGQASTRSHLSPGYWSGCWPQLVFVTTTDRGGDSGKTTTQVSGDESEADRWTLPKLASMGVRFGLGARAS